MVCPITITSEAINASFFEPMGKVYPERYTTEEMTVKESDALFADVDAAVESARAAQKMWSKVPMSIREKAVADVRAVAKYLANDLALMAISDTGRGRYDDKVAKQHLAATKTPGPECIKPTVVTGDSGMTVTDYSPYGVFGAVTPVTNPTATVINNTISMISGGNGIVFNVHPSAVACTNRAVAIFNEVIKNAGGPSGLIASIRVPTLQTGKDLLTHAKTDANLVTGGPAVVKVALNAGKKAFCAGPGNPPIVVDETANLALAAKSIYAGASFDNNMICSDEKEVFVVESVHDQLIKEFENAGAYILCEEEIEKLMGVVLKARVDDYTHGAVDAALVGQDASVIMAKIGVEIPESVRLCIAPVHEGHPFIWTELLMPILAVCRVADFDTALNLAHRAEYGFRHTSSIYTSRIDRITEMGRRMNTSLFTVNGNHLAALGAGGEGHTSFSITGFTGEGMTSAKTFCRERRMVCVDCMNFC